MYVHNKGSGLTRRSLMSVLAAMGALGATAALTSNAPIVSSQAQPRTVKIAYGDLNLSTPKGKQVLAQRIHQAVDLVCNQSDPRALQMWVEYRKCVQNASDSAWSQIRWRDKPIMEAGASAPPGP